MDDLDPAEVKRRAVHAGRDTRSHRLFAAFGTLLAVSVLVLFGLYLNQRAATGAVVGVAQQLTGQLRGLGATPVASVPAEIVGQRGETGATGKPGPGPTQQQVDGSVNRYLAEHPPAGATPAMVAARVAAYLAANPPAPGQNATSAEIATAVSTYVDAHPDEFRGPAGADATDAQVSAAVDAYCSAHNDCAGPAGTDGKQGDQGVGMSDLQFVRDDAGDCQVVVTLHDPATGTDTTVTHPAGDAACPPATAPTTTDPTTTTDPPLLGG